MSPHVNPVSTVFALQAIEMWREFETSGEAHAEGDVPCSKILI